MSRNSITAILWNSFQLNERIFFNGRDKFIQGETIMKKTGKRYFVFLVLWLLAGRGVPAFADQPLEIFLDPEGLLTVSAQNVLPEDIFLELGKVCDVEIIVKGEKLPENEVSLNFEKIPVKDAVKRLVRACGIKNYLMDSKKDSQGVSRLVKIDLSVGGGGQRVLTPGRQRKAVNRYNKPVAKKPKPAKAKNQKSKAASYDTSFQRDTNFQWDGSAPIAFPEYKGEMEYGKSQFAWDDEAKNFSENTMDMVPPGVRGFVSEQIIKMSDQIAKERGTDIITPDITAEAVQRIGKQSGLPPNVMNLMPKTTDDFDMPKIPIDSDVLKEEYRE